MAGADTFTFVGLGVVFTGLVYTLSGLWTQHFRKNLLPSWSDLQRQSLSTMISDRVRLKRLRNEEAPAYNVLQRMSYLAVVFGLFPLMIWTGLAMSPAFTSVFPVLATALGASNHAHGSFFVSVLLVLFLSSTSP
jgi:thiosulfate reductase cytochrome b subunit